MRHIDDHSQFVHSTHNGFSERTQSQLFERSRAGGFIECRTGPGGGIVPGQCHVSNATLEQGVKFTEVILDHMTAFHAQHRTEFMLFDGFFELPAFFDPHHLFGITFHPCLHGVDLPMCPGIWIDLFTTAEDGKNLNIHATFHHPSQI